MSVTIGAQLGNHELLGLLGKGGMGEVYRARDASLKREVAIKILTDEFTRNHDRVSRFQSETEVLTSLNHPNIAASIFIVVVLLCICTSALAGGIAELVTVSNIGPEGGSVGSIVIDPQNPNTIYAPTAAGVFKSYDGGTTWSNTLTGLFINNVFIDPQRPATLYGSGSGGLFTSYDAGATWNPVVRTVKVLNLVFLAVDPQNQGTLYATGGSSFPGNVIKSRDGGATWQAASLGIPDGSLIMALAVDPRNANTVYAAGLPGARLPQSVFKSTNGGASWTVVALGISSDGGLVPQGLVIDPNNTSTLYITTVTDVVKSTDGGRSWNKMSSGLSACCRRPVVIDPHNSTTLYSERIDGLIFKSTNGARSWTALNFYTDSLTVDPQNSNTLYAAYAARFGAFKSMDGGATWRAVNSGLRAIPVFSAVIDPQNPDTLYAGNFKSTDMGKTWGSIFAGAIMAIDPQNPGNLYAERPVSQSNSGDDCDPRSIGMFKSVDAGMSWVDTGLRDCVYYAVTVDPQNPSNVYAATEYNGLVKSIDAGGNWNPINAGLPTKSVTALAIDPKNPQILYAAAGLTLFKSTDGGVTWNSTALSVTNASLSAITIDPQNTSTLYAVDSTVPGGLWKSVDEAASWQNLPTLLESTVTPAIYALAASPKNPGKLYAGTNLGVITSSDGGESWVSLSSDVGPIRLLVIDPKRENTLYAGGQGGLFEIGPPIVTGITFDVAAINTGASYTATITGSNLSDNMYFDIQVRAPGSVADIVALNWQTGTSASHSIPVGMDIGTWTINGVRAHQDPDNHTGNFVTVSATITVSP